MRSTSKEKGAFDFPRTLKPTYLPPGYKLPGRLQEPAGLVSASQGDNGQDTAFLRALTGRIQTKRGSDVLDSERQRSWELKRSGIDTPLLLLSAVPYLLNMLCTLSSM